MTCPVYSQDAACLEAIDWLQMEALIFKTEGKTGNAAMAENVAKLIETLRINLPDYRRTIVASVDGL